MDRGDIRREVRIQKLIAYLFGLEGAKGQRDFLNVISLLM